MEDEERFTQIFRSCQPKVQAYARRRVAADLVGEVVADTFIAAWRHLDRLPDDPLPWLYRAASLEVAHHRRRQDRDRRQRPMATVAHLDRPEGDVAEGIARADHWRRAFSQLAQGDQELLRLVAWEELTPQQASEVMGCSTVAFKVRLHRARRRLLAALEAQGLPAPEMTEATDSPPPGVVPLRHLTTAPADKAPHRPSAVKEVLP